MFRKTIKQASFFDIEEILFGILPKTDWSYTYKKHVLPLIDEEKFRHLFTRKGRPNKPIRVLISLLIFMGIEKLTWRGAEFQFPRRLDWLNATDSVLGIPSIDHTTLFKFYQRLEADDSTRKLFETLTFEFVTLCGTSPGKQRTDSFFIHGWLKTLSRYGLFKETLRVFLRELKKKAPVLYEKTKEMLSQAYLEKKFDLTEKEPEKVKQRLQEMSRDMYLLNQEFANHEIVKEFAGFRILAKVFNQQCTIIELIEGTKTAIEIQLREKPEGDQIINTPHNVEALYTKKGNQKVIGSKGFLTETCEENNLTQFITDVKVTKITKADLDEVPEIQERLETVNLKPRHQYSDAGFVTGRTILDSRQNGIELEGPSTGRSLSNNVYQDRSLDAADFEVTIDKETKEMRVLNCPEKQCPTGQSRSEITGKLILHFEPKICSQCPVLERCPVRIGVNVAAFQLDEAMYVGAARYHQYMESKTYQKECATRAGVEGTVSEMTRAHGMRKARHRRESRIELQMLFGAIACNVKRFIRHGMKYNYLELNAVISR